MSIVRAKIERASSAPNLDVGGIQAAFYPCQESFSALCERLVPYPKWRCEAIDEARLSQSELVEGLPDKGLFYGFGPDDKTYTAFLSVDPKLAYLTTQCSFLDAAGFEDMAFDFETEQDIQKLDLLMMEVFADSFSNYLRAISVPTVSTVHRNQQTRKTPFDFSDSEENWVRLTAKFSIKSRPSLRPQDEEASVGEGGPKGKGEAVDKSAQAWPELKVDIYLPESYIIDFVIPAAPKERASEDYGSIETNEYWRNCIDSSTTSLKAVLETFKMSVADCTKLQVGEVIPLPGVSLRNLNVVVDLKSEKVILSQAELGIHKTHRAIRLSNDPAEDFVADAQLAVS